MSTSAWPGGTDTAGGNDGAHDVDMSAEFVYSVASSVHGSHVDLDALGPPRQTTLQQRRFLSRMAVKYQQIVFDSLKGNYDSDWDAKDRRKLRMYLHLENEQFADRMTHDGHTRAFRNVDDTADTEYGSSAQSQESIYAWIRQRYRVSRGSELPGTVNLTVLESLFRLQAVNWQTIATEHLNTVDKIISNFNEVVWPDLAIEESVRREFEARNASSARTAWLKTSEQLELILADEMKGILQTVNHYFADTLAATRQDRVLHRLKGLGLQAGQSIQVNLAQLTGAAHLSNEEQAVFDIHDILRAYYKVAIKRFTDNVVVQVIKRCYLDETGPVKYVSPGYIGELTNEELSHITAESYATSSVRNEISYRLERLAAAPSDRRSRGCECDLFELQANEAFIPKLRIRFPHWVFRMHDANAEAILVRSEHVVDVIS